MEFHIIISGDHNRLTLTLWKTEKDKSQGLTVTADANHTIYDYGIYGNFVFCGVLCLTAKAKAKLENFYFDVFCEL